jgi:hypothetical protein
MPYAASSNGRDMNIWFSQLVRRWARTGAEVLLVSAVFSAGCAGAQNSLSPMDLVRRTIKNEINDSGNGPNFMFREISEGPDGSKTKLMIETRDAMAGLLIAVNGHPLSDQERLNEIGRLDHLANDANDLERKHKREKEDAERTKRIISAFPDAFLYENGGTVPGEEAMGAPGDPLVRLKFRPNPKYSPPSHLEQILTGLEGTLLIDGKQYRIAKIDASLMKQVEFGWGILGHLDRGGHFLVQQGDMGNGKWEITRLDLAFIGKAVMFKTLHIRQKEVCSNFKPAPRGLTFAQGVEMLKKQEALIAQNHPPVSTVNASR